MIKQLQSWMVTGFDYLLLEWFDLFMPGWLDEVMEDIFGSPMIDLAPEQMMPAAMYSNDYAESDIKMYSVVKDKMLFFDYNLN